MTAIWLLSTRSRPDQAQACIDACTQAGMTSPGVVYVDGSPGYNLRAPDNWRVHMSTEWLGLQGSMQWCLTEYPDASQYGWLADDTRPRTRGWDSRLQQAAGDWNLAYAADNWISNDPTEAQRLREGHNLSSGLCWGGALVRSVGWWALPGVFQAGIDTAWTELVRPWKQHRYLEDVLVEHLHWRAGTRPPDAVDRGPWIDQDIVTRDQWTWSPAYREALVAAGHGTPLTYEPRKAIKVSEANEAFVANPMPAARLLRMLEADDLGSHPDT